MENEEDTKSTKTTKNTKEEKKTKGKEEEIEKAADEEWPSGFFSGRYSTFFFLLRVLCDLCGLRVPPRIREVQ
jgi:hypothetical protein